MRINKRTNSSIKRLNTFGLSYWEYNLYHIGNRTRGKIHNNTKVSGTCPPPRNRTKFFCLYICFHQKAPVSEVGAPSNEGWCPPNGKSWIHPCKGITLFKTIRLQWYYNNWLQELVTSIHFVKIKTISFCKTRWIRTDTSRSFSDFQSYAVHTELLVIGCEQLFD